MPVQRNIRKNSDLKFVMLHHSEHFESVSGKDINAAFVQEGLFGSPFDIIVNTNGRIDLSPRWIRAANPTQYIENAPLYSVFKYTLHDIADACSNQQMNYQAIHILLLGNFDDDVPSIAQINTLEKLIVLVRDNVPSVKDILFHGDIVSTSCPGLRFSDAVHKDKLRNILLPNVPDMHLFELEGALVPILHIVDSVEPTIDLAWNNVAQAAHKTVAFYNVYRINVTLNGTITKIGTSTGLTFADTPVIAGFTYTYYVSAVFNDSTESQLSNAATATVTAAPASSLKYLYMMTDDGVTPNINVVDVSNPLVPVDLGLAFTLGETLTNLPIQIISDAQYAYLVVNFKIFIFDWATVPTILSQVGLFSDTSKKFIGHAIKYGTRLILPSTNTAVFVGSVDISNPATPTFLSSTPTAAVTAFVGLNGAIDINGKFWSGIADPTFTDVGFYSTPVATESIGASTFEFATEAVGFGFHVVIGNFLYVGSGGFPDIFQVYDISSGISFVMEYSIGDTVPFAFTRTLPLVRGNFMYIPLQDDTTGFVFQIVDVSTPSTPTFVANSPSVFPTFDGFPQGIVINGDFLYCASMATGTFDMYLLIFNIANPALPVFVTSLLVESMANPPANIVNAAVWGYPNEGIDGRNLIVTP